MSPPPDLMAEIRAGFFVECDELLEALTDALNAPELGIPGDAAIHTAFRAVHSIKGGAGAFDLKDLVASAHGFETRLDPLRSGGEPLSAELRASLIAAADELAGQVEAARRGQPQMANPSPAQFSPGGQDTAPWVLSLTPSAALYATGNETLHLLNALAELGDAEIRCDLGAIPTLGDLNPEAGVLRWQIALPADVPEPAIRETFEFVEDLCDLSISRQAALSEDTTEASPPVVQAAPGTTVARQAADTATVRVDLDRIDRLMNLAGELVISQSMLAQTLTRTQTHKSGDRYSPEAAALASLGSLARDLQDAVIAIRSQPVKPLFQRMGRVLREASLSLGKPAELIASGESTEVDRSIIERLAEPLTHMIRNAVDHGLETAADRRAAGKAGTGLVTLSAAHRSGRVIIELADDGAGLRRDKIRDTAVAKGLIAADAVLSEGAIDDLLFLPGFSTAATISALSGRGVGMDVVRAALQALGGRITIQSCPGRGTRFTISLPLTLAVMDGMVVRAGGQTLVIPLAMIIETAALSGASLHDQSNGQNLIRLRGGNVSLCDVALTLGFAAPLAAHKPGQRIAILICDEEDRRVALIVDQVLDQRQVVIKGLRDNCGQVPGIAAATILGDGRVALILDPSALISMAAPPPGPHFTAPQIRKVG